MGSTLHEVVQVHKLRHRVYLVGVSTFVLYLSYFVWLRLLGRSSGLSIFFQSELLPLGLGVLSFFIHLHF